MINFKNMMKFKLMPLILYRYFYIKITNYNFYFPQKKIIIFINDIKTCKIISLMQIILSLSSLKIILWYDISMFQTYEIFLKKKNMN